MHRTRYWIDNGGSWEPDNRSVWSRTPGGPGGASVPAGFDDVVVLEGGTMRLPTTSNGVTIGHLVCRTPTSTRFGSRHLQALRDWWNFRPHWWKRWRRRNKILIG